MNQIKLQGSYENMGVQQGLIIKQLGMQLPPPTKDSLILASACQDLLAEYAPELFIEMESLVKTSGADPEALTILLLTAPFAQTTPSCSVVAVTPERSKSQRAIIGRNYDFLYTISKAAATTYSTYPDGKYASLGNSDIFVGRADGLNESGLFVAMTATFLPGIKPGLAFWFIVRMLLDRCENVEEALELIQAVPHAQSRNYMLVDKTGRAIVVEASIDGIEFRNPEQGLLVMTNHNLSPSYCGKEMLLPPDSPLRYKRLRALINHDNLIDIQDVKSALNDRENYVCAHGEFEGQSFGTIWSLVGHPGDRQFEIADGCTIGEMVYHSVQF